MRILHCVAVAIVCSSYITVLYSYLNLTILDFPHSIELVFSSPLFLFCVHLCFSFLADLYFISTVFNADVNWLRGSASPYGYSRQPVLQLSLLIFSLL